MLYQIKDKSDVILGVHECPPAEIRRYLASLPRQQAPYEASELPCKRRGIGDFTKDALDGWSILRGLIFGAILAQPFDLALYFVLKHFGGQ